MTPLNFTETNGVLRAERDGIENPIALPVFANTEHGLHLRVLKQTKHGYPDGNCFATCIAMITGIELAEIPNFASYTEANGNWWKDICDWLAPRGWGGIILTFDAMQKNIADCYGFRQVGMPFILTGKSPGGDYNHCVVQWDESEGTRELDPALSEKGVLEPIADIIILVPISAYKSHADAITTSGEEKVAEMRQKLYVPGTWKCRTCGFVQSRNVICPNGIFANTETLMEPCPNEGDVMFPMTWEEMAKENQAFGIRLLDEKATLEAKLKVAREGLKIADDRLHLIAGCYMALAHGESYKHLSDAIREMGDDMTKITHALTALDQPETEGKV